MVARKFPDDDELLLAALKAKKARAGSERVVPPGNVSRANEREATSVGVTTIKLCRRQLRCDDNGQ